MSGETVLLERRGPAAWLTLNRPEKLNAMNGEMVNELRARLLEVENDETVKVVVVTGAGRAFSAGYDISEEVTDKIVGADQWRSVLAVDVELAMQLWALSRPTIAAVRGWCLAGACELAMACDMIVSTTDARFGEPDVLPQILKGAGFEVTRMTEMVTGGRTRDAHEWIDLMAGAGPLPFTLIRALGPHYRIELEAEVEAAMESLGDPDDAFRYHHSYLIAVARKL